MNDCKKHNILCHFSDEEGSCNQEQEICNQWRQNYATIMEISENFKRCPIKENQFCLKAGRGDPCDGGIGDCNLRDKIYSKIKSQVNNFGNLSEVFERDLYIRTYLNLE